MVRRSFALLVVSLLASPALAQNWAQWRGPNFNGAAEGSGYPVSWSANENSNENIAWSVALPGGSGSTPAVWGDRIFVTCPGDGQNLLICYTTGGDELWHTAIGSEVPGKHKKGSGANPSPTTDGERVYAYYKSGDLAAVDFDGETIWSKNLQEMFGKDELWWDLGTSPVLTRDFVIVAVVQTGPSYFAAFDRATGELAWKQDRVTDAPLESAQTYATPIVVGDPGNETLVMIGGDYLTANDATDGAELWRVGTLNPDQEQMWRSIASAAVDGDVAVGPYARGDTLTAVRLGGSGDVTESHVIWEKSFGSDVPTPAAHENNLYVLGDKGDLTCLDIRTGQELWSGRLPGRPSFSSSPILADGKLYCTREDGVVFVTAADHFEVLAENELSGDFTAATPVFHEGNILLKTFDRLYCIGE